MKFRNCLGNLEPRIGNYFIRKEEDNFKIMKNEGWYVTDACYANEKYAFMLELPTFKSMVQAFAWLREHINELL